MNIKDCPFCGGIGNMGRVDRYPDCDIQEDKYAYYIRCVSCACEGPWAKSESSATKLWNTRTRPDPMSKEEAEKLVQEFKNSWLNHYTIYESVKDKLIAALTGKEG